MVKIISLKEPINNDTNEITYRKHKHKSRLKVVHNKTSIIKLFSTNAAGVVTGKTDSLNNEVKATGANIVAIQETHSMQKGRIKFHNNFVVFEAIRKAKHGGTMCAVNKNLNPKLIEEYNSPFELLVVEVETKNKQIRVMTGCGPQENWDEEKRMPFFIALETEIVKAELAGKSIIIAMDANSKLGPEYIPKDTHDMSANGKLLGNIIKRHALVVANGSEKCTGTVTRRRATKFRTEESCIDIVMFSSDMSSHFKSLYIDEQKKHVLTRISKTKKGIVHKESDHNVLITEFDQLHITNNDKAKVELYNLKNSDCQKKFKAYTSNTNMLSSVFDSNENINVLTNRFIKKLDGCIKVNFKKVRLNRNKPTQYENLYNQLRELKGKEDKESINQIKKVIEAIAKEAEKKYYKVVEELKTMKPDGGKINSHKFWNLKKKICPKSKDPPSAMIDKDGNLLTTHEDIEKRQLRYTQKG